MIKTKYLILGAGPSGLTFATMLQNKGISDYILIEKESSVGGLCRSCIVDGSALDVGGGHFLDERNQIACEFLFDFMPKNEWNLYKRNSKILFKGREIDHPFESNIWQMDVHDQVEYLKDIARAGCNVGREKPEGFVEWIYWKLGSKIADDYMLPYNRKMFGDALEDLGTYWLDKLPNVSFEETMMSCLTKKAYGTEPGHTNFFYPRRHGYGEVWNRIGKKCGDRLKCNERVKKIIIDEHIVSTTNEEYQAETIIVTIPWNDFDVETEDEIALSIKRLRHTSIEVSYHSEKVKTDAHWIYVPEMSLPYHRILVRHNFLEGSRGYWTETNIDRVSKVRGAFCCKNEYAYPLNTQEKPRLMEIILTYFEKKGIYGLGRWGEHQHYNSDVCIMKAMDLARKIV